MDLKTDLKQIDSVDVFCKDTRAGQLRRTTHGAAFAYNPAYLMAGSPAIAFHLPCTSEEIITHGVNLHPFFAGLLPEGLRLQALVKSVKTSADDLFSLLIASGGDCIGDVSVVPTGTLPPAETSISLLIDPQSASFDELFQQALRAELTARREPAIPGVQHKISAQRLALPVRLRRNLKQYILKLSGKDTPRIIENEYFFMMLARRLGFLTPAIEILTDKNNTTALLVERFDRLQTNSRLVKVHQEDACQFLNVYPADKYRLKCSAIAEGIARWSTAPILETANFMRLTALSYLIGNGDLHAKNISLIADPQSGLITFSPVYDLLSTLPYGDAQMALEFEGRKDNFKAADFLRFGKRHDIAPKALQSMLMKLCREITPCIGRLEEIGLHAKRTAHLRKMMLKRQRDLSVT